MTTTSSTPASSTDEPGGTPSRVPRSVRLDDARARDAHLVGAKAAALSRAAAAGLPVLPGFVITTAATALLGAAGPAATPLPAEVRVRWQSLAEQGRRPLAVRSSSTVEDLAGSSMAGRFTTVLGVEGWDAFVAAVATVVASGPQGAAEGTGRPLAVLVQPLVHAELGGVLFGLDPVTGAGGRLVVAVVRGGPEPLVSGRVDGDHHELDRRGRVLRHVPGRGGAPLPSALRRRLVALAARAEATFGAPQDIEWALDPAGELWLLQSRPVTGASAGVGVGPLLGPGPVAETFPEPLSRLEEDLWVPPLREALEVVFDLVGTMPRGDQRSSPPVVAVGGRVAADLVLLGDEVPAAGALRALDPRPRLRRLRASWRVGRLRAALPGLAEDLLEGIDADLLAVPALAVLSDRQLLALLDRVGVALRAVHGHEVLLGLLVSRRAPRFTGASVALRVLAGARAAGLAESDIPVRHPVVLALTAPQVSAGPVLPAVEVDTGWAPVPEGDAAALRREALRLRVRWLQELGGRATWVLAERLAERAVLARPEDVRDLHLDDLVALVSGRAELWEVHPAARQAPPPLPARFRRSPTGVPVAERRAGHHPGTGAGGGRGRGPAHRLPAPPPAGSVLVVRTLDPAIAPHLPRLAGLVAETGSVLAHLAILAREAGVATAVGVDDAWARFPPGTVLTVDGTTGEVSVEGPP